MIYRLDSFLESQVNPITESEYDTSWLILMLTDSDKYQQLVGFQNGCAYTIKISRLTFKNWMMDVGDFISFYEGSGKNIVLVMSENDYTKVQRYYHGHRYDDVLLRENEPSDLIHSTSMDSWEHIKKDGMLKCWSRLKSESSISETTPIGMKLGDPLDFSDYIMFGGGVTGEIVVNSRQKGKITMDVDSEYLTGARLYFDAKRIAQDGLLVRDGSHLKVKDTLPLQPYLIWAATWDVVGLENQVSTPRIFAEQADKAFQRFCIINSE